jgi:hypothetical protein
MWIKHQIVSADLPQTCARCGVLLVADAVNKDTGARIADPLEPGDVYSQDEEDRTTIAVAIPIGEKFESCKKA